MTYEELKKDIDEYKELKEAYKRGEIDDGMTDEERKAWIEKCNSQFSKEDLSRSLAQNIGKKIDIVCSDGEEYSGYIFEYSLAEDSDIGEESITLAPIGKDFQVEIPVKDIVNFSVDPNYKSYD